MRLFVKDFSVMRRHSISSTPLLTVIQRITVTDRWAASATSKAAQYQRLQLESQQEVPQFFHLRSLGLDAAFLVLYLEFQSFRMESRDLHQLILLPLAWFVCFSLTVTVSGLSPSSPSSPSSQLNALLKQASVSKQALPLIGVHDALSAKIIQDEYFKAKKNVALFVSGFGVSAARLGVPDAGIWTRTDLADTVQQISLLHTLGEVPPSLSSSPENESSLLSKQQQQQQPLIIADGDTGFGGTPNIRHLIRQMAGLNVAAITIEDQIFPKRCTYAAVGGVTVVDRHDACKRIQTVLAARDEVHERTGRYVSIIARTDCRRQLGLGESIARCVDFEKLGGDIVYAENLASTEEYLQLRQSVSDHTPMMLAQVQNPGSNQNHWTLNDIGAMGYDMGLFGVTGLQATVAALRNVASRLVQDDGLVDGSDCDDDATNDGSFPIQLASLDEIKTIVGFDDLNEFEDKQNCT